VETTPHPTLLVAKHFPGVYAIPPTSQIKKRASGNDWPARFSPFDDIINCGGENIGPLLAAEPAVDGYVTTVGTMFLLVIGELYCWLKIRNWPWRPLTSTVAPRVSTII
jgi:hypothetical protein